MAKRFFKLFSTEIAKSAYKTALIFSILGWGIFLCNDALAELVFKSETLLGDLGLISIPTFSVIIFMIVDPVKSQKQYEECTNTKDFNVPLFFSFLLISLILLAISWIMTSYDIWIIPQTRHSGFIDLNGIEYLLFPIFYPGVSIIECTIYKLIIFIRKKATLKK